MSAKILILFAIAMAIIAIEVSFMQIGWDEFVKSDRRLFPLPRLTSSLEPMGDGAGRRLAPCRAQMFILRALLG